RSSGSLPDWDEDSPELRANLAQALRQAANDALARTPPGLAVARSWHRETMKGLDLPHPEWAGGYRGEPALADCWVRIGASWGVPPAEVAEALAGFERTLRQAVAALDARVPAGSIADETTLPAVLRLCAWAHAEWVRI